MLRVLLVLLAFPVLVIAAAEEVDEDPFNVDFFCGWGGYYRPMEWTPVEIGISSTLTEPFAGLITVSAQQDGLNTMNVNYEFVLTPDIPLHLPLVTKFAFTADKCSVRLVDKDRGRTQWSQDYELWGMETNNRFITVVNENDLLIGLVGSRKFGLLRLPKQSKCLSHKGPGEVYVGDKLPRMIPWDWTCLSSMTRTGTCLTPSSSMRSPNGSPTAANCCSCWGAIPRRPRILLLSYNRLNCRMSNK